MQRKKNPGNEVLVLNCYHYYYYFFLVLYLIEWSGGTFKKKNRENEVKFRLKLQGLSSKSCCLSIKNNMLHFVYKIYIHTRIGKYEVT